VTLEEDIILDGVVPEPLNSRGHWGLTKIDLKKIPPSMVVVYLPILLTFFVIFLGSKVDFTLLGMANRPQSLFSTEKTKTTAYNMRMYETFL
jgi:hypothetical protein